MHTDAPIKPLQYPKREREKRRDKKKGESVAGDVKCANSTTILKKQRHVS
jgi:hypothetical protein